MNVSSCIDRRFSVVVKECDEIYQIGRNEISTFIPSLQCLHVLEYKSGWRDSLYRENNLLLDSEDFAMKVFKFLLCYLLLSYRLARSD